jgi:hypothetical protein
MAQMKIVYTTSNKLDDLAIESGQIIFVVDTHTIYMDMKDRRTSYSTIYVFETEAERLAYENPAQGFYFVDETHVVWRYKSNWIQITPERLRPIVFGKEVSSFPLRGEEGILYIADQAIYK